MVAMLRKGLQDVQPDYAACVFDDKGKTFRDEWYPQYKATRSAMPDALAQQIEPINEVVKLLGWPVLCVPGIEADDAIGTIAQAAARAGHKVIVSTGDKDLAQLVDESVTLINTMSNERLDVEGVKAKFGVPPERHRRLPDARRRLGRQRAGRRQGGSEDGGQAGSPSTARSRA